MPDDAAPPRDTGLQLERTSLAWKRTVLALGVAFLTGSRLAAPVFGPVAYVIGLGGLVVTSLCWWGVTRRYEVLRGRMRTGAFTHPSARVPFENEPPVSSARYVVAAAGLTAVLVIGGALTVVLSFVVP